MHRSNFPRLSYPDHSAFEQLLGSCGSMTKSLQKLHYDFSVTLLANTTTAERFKRYTLLKLNNTPVIIALSSCLISASAFYAILKNADTIPLGKFLFAPDSQIQRNSLQISQVLAQESSDTLIADYLNSNYATGQHFWRRYSTFSYAEQSMDLEEIILPEITMLYPETNVNL